MTEQTDDAPQGPPELDLRPDGTIVATIDGEQYRVRRPKLGEFRKLRTLLHEAQDDLNVRATAIRKETERLRAEAESDEGDAAARLAEVNRLDREYTEANEVGNIEWLRSAFDMLADQPLPGEDDLPLWAADGRTITQVIAHWRNVPLLSGPS